MKRLFFITPILLWACFCIVHASEKFRFAQLTDIHISSDATKQYLSQSINQINADSSIAFVLVTGDLTDNGDNASLEWFANELKRFNKPYHVVCGNHETTWTESGLETFSRLFNGERFSFIYKDFLFLGFNTGPFVRMAYGHVAPQDLTWAQEEVRKHGKGKKVVIVTHYPLQQGDVDNWYEATDALRKCKPVCMIGGHYHTNRFLSYDGIPGILGRSNLKDKQGHVGYTEYICTEDSLLVCEHNIGQTPRQWAAVSINQLAYDPNGHAEQYPDFSVNDRYPQVQKVWCLSTGTGIYCSPAVKGKWCFTGDTEGKVVCRDWTREGKTIWTCHLGGKIVGNPAVSGNYLVVPSTDHNIYCLDTKTGTKVWTIPTDEAQMGSVAVKGKTAYVAGGDHKMRAIDIPSGKIIWTYNHVAGYAVSLPLLADGKVIFGAWDKTLYALDAKTGKEIWKWVHPRGGMHYSPAGVWPVTDGKAVYIVDPERAMTAIDLKTGTQLWRTKDWNGRPSKVRESLGISKDRKRLYAKTMNDSIICYYTNPESPKEAWGCNAGFGYEHATTMLAECEGTVYSSTKEGLVVAVDGKSGRLQWIHKTGNSFINTVVPLKGGYILFTETSGEIALLKSDK